jgi:carboxymethylenebutenolidase
VFAVTAAHGTSVDVPTPDGVADAYLTHPDDGAARPGVLFYTDAPGLRAWTREMADRLASCGYTVLVPNVFYRAGRAPMVTPPDQIEPQAVGRYIAEQVMPLVYALTPAMLVRDAGAYLDWLAASEHVTDGPVGATGYCVGAALMLRTASAYPDRIAAGGGFHGGGLASEMPDSPHLGAGTVTAELYFGHADQDESLPPEQIERLNEALDAAGVRYRAEVYAGAFHGYTQADFSRFGRYNALAAERHWRELVALFDSTLR